jgi:hypothetical protein
LDDGENVVEESADGGAVALVAGIDHAEKVVDQTAEESLAQVMGAVRDREQPPPPVLGVALTPHEIEPLQPVHERRNGSRG